MGSLGIRRRLDQSLNANHAPSQQQQLQRQRVSLKRRRPYQDEQRPVLAPCSASRQLLAAPRTPQVGESGEEEDGEDEVEEEGEGDPDDDSEYEEEEGSEEEDSDEDGGGATGVAKHQQPQKQQCRNLAATSAAAAATTTTSPPRPQTKRQRQSKGAVDSSSSRGKTPKVSSQSQRQLKTQKREGAMHSQEQGGAGAWGSRERSGGPGGGEHECLVCGKTFGKASKLVRHAATHTGEKPFRCDEESCSKAFATKDKLKRHALSHARRKAGLSVSVGSAARREAETRQNAALFAEKAAAAGVSLQPVAGTSPADPFLHYTPTTAPLLEASRMERERALGGSGSGTSTGGGWKHSCATCGRNFLDNYHLKRHVKAIHEGPRPYTCDHPVVAASPHITSSSSSSSSVIPTVPGGRVDGDTETKNTRQGDVGVVQKRKGRAEEEKEAGRSEAGEVGAAETEVEQQGRARGVCGAAFAKKWQLREHLYAEHGQTRYNSRQHRCPYLGCGREFDRPSKLAAHEKTHEARFVCEFDGCKAAFVLASGLNLHLKEEHPFRCGVCDMIFDREDKMQIHQGTHGRAGDGDYIRPHHCNVLGCGKSFTEKRNLNAHRRTRHTEGWRKRFRCEASGCTMTYAHRHTLVKHVKREHQRPSSGSTSKSNLKSANSKVKSAESISSTSSRWQDSSTVAAPAEAGPSAAGTRETEGKGPADPPAESGVEGPPEQSVARSADQSLEPPVERSNVAAEGRSSSSSVSSGSVAIEL
ncbi:unnamed protein product [Pylaiella littoralis]